MRVLRLGDRERLLLLGERLRGGGLLERELRLRRGLRERDLERLRE